MPRSVFTGSYSVLLRALIDARKTAGISQAELAERLGKPQPFISKVERGVRRIDVVEYVAFCRAMGGDPVDMLASILQKLPKSIEI